MRPPNESAPTGQGRGAGAQSNWNGYSANHARIIDRLQFRLSANALALDALGPDLDYAMRCAHLMSLGMPLPEDAPQRLNRLSLRLIDARHVLEAELPPPLGSLEPDGEQARKRQEIAGESFGSGKQLSADRRTPVDNPGRASEKLAEIDENLCRSELTPTEEAEHIGRRKEVWEAMREAERASDLVGETGGSTCATSLSDGRAAGPQHEEGFAASTAAATGKSKASTNRAARRYTEVCQAGKEVHP